MHVDLSHNEFLRLIIAVGTFFFLIDIMYWVIRFGFDYWRSRALVALGLFSLMFAMATRQMWSVYVAALPVISIEWYLDLRIFNNYLRIATVVIAIFSTRFLRYAFRKERDQNGQANEN